MIQKGDIKKPSHIFMKQIHITLNWDKASPQEGEGRLYLESNPTNFTKNKV